MAQPANYNVLFRVGLFGNAARYGKLHLKLNTYLRPIASKYRERKMKRTLKRELKSMLNRLKGNEWTPFEIQRDVYGSPGLADLNRPRSRALHSRPSPFSWTRVNVAWDFPDLGSTEMDAAHASCG